MLPICYASDTRSLAEKRKDQTLVAYNWPGVSILAEVTRHVALIAQAVVGTGYSKKQEKSSWPVILRKRYRKAQSISLLAAIFDFLDHTGR